MEQALFSALAVSRTDKTPVAMQLNILEQGFPASALLTSWTGYFFVVGSSPVHGGMFSCIPGLSSLDASSTSSHL